MRPVPFLGPQTGAELAEAVHWDRSANLVWMELWAREIDQEVMEPLTMFEGTERFEEAQLEAGIENTLKSHFRGFPGGRAFR